MKNNKNKNKFLTKNGTNSESMEPAMSDKGLENYMCLGAYCRHDMHTRVSTT